jgi:excisionase family DNA binding protein
MDPMLSPIARAIAEEVLSRLKDMLMTMQTPAVQPALLDVKQAATYLGRTEQAVQHLIFDKELPVVRVGRRVHLHRADLDAWIEQNKY